MPEPVLNIARDIAIIVLALEAIAFSAVALVLLFRLVQFWRERRSRSYAKIHQAALAVMQYSEQTRRVASRISRVAATVQSIPEAAKTGFHAWLRRRRKEAPRV